MKVLNKLGPKINFIAIETPEGEIVRLGFKEAEAFAIELNDALYERKPLLIQKKNGEFEYV